VKIKRTHPMTFRRLCSAMANLLGRLDEIEDMDEWERLYDEAQKDIQGDWALVYKIAESLGKTAVKVSIKDMENYLGSRVEVVMKKHQPTGPSRIGWKAKFKTPSQN